MRYVQIFIYFDLKFKNVNKKGFLKSGKEKKSNPASARHGYQEFLSVKSNIYIFLDFYLRPGVQLSSVDFVPHLTSDYVQF
jgi:hypothetical protein